MELTKIVIVILIGFLVRGVQKVTELQQQLSSKEEEIEALEANRHQHIMVL